MQKSYINALYELIKEDSNVISCLSDSGTDYDEIIAREFPNQCLNFGISENNKVAAASGMASCGKIPFVYTTSTFLIYRSYEFIRDDICLQNRNVKLIGMGSGLTWSTLGPTHHATEDIALLHSLPNITVLSPATPIELEGCVKKAYEIKGPVYIRMGMSNEKEIYDNDYEFKIEENVTIKDGKDILIYTTGSIISEVLEASKLLELDCVSVKIVNIHTLKPFNEQLIVADLANFKTVFSIEEHNINGGLGSIISEVIASNNISSKLYKIGLNDVFAIDYGTHTQILKSNNLDSSSIYNIIKKSIG